VNRVFLQGTMPDCHVATARRHFVFIFPFPKFPAQQAGKICEFYVLCFQ
jgi:hypothetical protein